MRTYVDKLKNPTTSHPSSIYNTKKTKVSNQFITFSLFKWSLSQATVGSSSLVIPLSLHALNKVDAGYKLLQHQHNVLQSPRSFHLLHLFHLPSTPSNNIDSF